MADVSENKGGGVQASASPAWSAADEARAVAAYAAEAARIFGAR